MIRRLPPIPCSRHVVVFPHLYQKYYVPPLTQHFLYRNRRQYQYGVRSPRTLTQSAAQQPADYGGSGIGCWSWFPLTLCHFNPESVSGPSLVTLGPPEWRWAGMLRWVWSVCRWQPPGLSRSARDSAFSRCSIHQVGSRRSLSLPPARCLPPSCAPTSTPHCIPYFVYNNPCLWYWSLSGSLG